MVIIRAVGRSVDGLTGLLKQSAKLTDAEIRVALALFEGQSLTQYAGQSDLAIGTVRQQIKSVFRKTGTGRQAELVTWIRRLQANDGAYPLTSPRNPLTLTINGQQCALYPIGVSAVTLR